MISFDLWSTLLDSCASFELLHQFKIELIEKKESKVFVIEEFEHIFCTKTIESEIKSELQLALQRRE